MDCTGLSYSINRPILPKLRQIYPWNSKTICMSKGIFLLLPPAHNFSQKMAIVGEKFCHAARMGLFQR